MIQIVFQNESFVVCDKPALVLSVPAREKTDQRYCLGLELQKEMQTQVFPVHRLDFEVSGLILYALNSQAHKASQNWFESKKIQKKYVAYTTLQNFMHWPENVNTDKTVIDISEGKKFHWNSRILKGKRRSFLSEQGENAETKAMITNVGKDELCWELSPVTGKSHQLRLELSRHGFPIHGDQLYGSTVKWKQPGIALRAFSLDLSEVNDRCGLPKILTIEK